MSNKHGETLGTHWAIRVGFSDSVSAPGPGVGATVGIIEIRNLDTGEIGSYTMTSVDAGVGIGLGTSIGNGQWAIFETAHPETLRGFEGIISTPNMQIGSTSVESRIGLPVEIKHDSVFARWWDGNSVDVSRTSSSFGLGVSEGAGVLQLDHVTQGPPEPNLIDGGAEQYLLQGAAERFYEQFETSHPDVQPPPPNGEGLGHDGGAEELMSFPSGSGPGDSADSGLASPFADLADGGADPGLAAPAPDLDSADFSPVGLSTGDLSAPNLITADLSTEVGLADQAAPDALVPPGWDTRDASFGVGLADDNQGIPLEAGGVGFPADPHNSIGLADDVLLANAVFGDGSLLFDDPTPGYGDAPLDLGIPGGDHGTDDAVDPGMM
jgi:hypothetical protein